MNSIWLENLNTKKSNKLENNINTDVCIIGAGITGITIGYKLNKENIPFIIVEKDYIASKSSGYTTAKITSQHGLIYSYLKNAYSLKFASDYLYANESAIEDIKRIIFNEKIECNFEIKSSYVFTNDSKKVNDIKSEYDTLNKIGFKTNLLNNVNLPLKSLAAIEFTNQAQFTPTKYILELANKFYENIYENTCVKKIYKNGSSFIVETENGNNITCKKLVIATKYPIKDIPGFYFTKLYQETSYVIAIKTDKKIDGMFINCDIPKISLRSVNYNNENIILLGGQNNRTGEKVNILDKYKNLENIAKSMFDKFEILFKWNTEDTISLDKIPYIGKYSNLYKNCYVATGFNKWGMTSSNIAANIIFNNIIGKKYKYEHVFNSTRFNILKNRKAIGELTKESIKGLVTNKLKVKMEDYNNLENGNGIIIKEKGKLVGVFKDISGKIYKVNPICTHLGCLLNFNRLDKTWDCSCHGSRYTYDGKIIYGPSSKNLEKIEE